MLKALNVKIEVKYINQQNFHGQKKIRDILVIKKHIMTFHKIREVEADLHQSDLIMIIKVHYKRYSKRLFIINKKYFKTTGRSLSSQS